MNQVIVVVNIPVASRHVQHISAWPHAVSFIMGMSTFVGLVCDLESRTNARAVLTMLHLATVLTAVVLGSLAN